MRIESDSLIAGYPILDVRKILRNLDDHGGYITSLDAAKLLHIATNKVHAALKCFETEGLLCITKTIKSDRAKPTKAFQVELSDKAHSLRMAKACKPITKAYADQAVAVFLERCTIVNKDPFYHYKVIKVLVFGSYLRAATFYGDVDLVIYLDRKDRAPNFGGISARQKREEALANGRRFSSLGEEMMWPYTETLLFLKSKSRTLSFHSTGDGILKRTEKCELFPKNNLVAYRELHATGS